VHIIGRNEQNRYRTDLLYRSVFCHSFYLYGAHVNVMCLRNTLLIVKRFLYFYGVNKVILNSVAKKLSRFHRLVESSVHISKIIQTQSSLLSTSCFRPILYIVFTNARNDVFLCYFELCV